MENKFEKLSELLKNEAIATRLLAMSPEEASVVLNGEFGLEFSVDELNAIAKGIVDSQKADSSDELSDVDLDQVAGGKASAYDYGKSVGKFVPAAVVVALAVVAVW